MTSDTRTPDDRFWTKDSRGQELRHAEVVTDVGSLAEKMKAAQRKGYLEGIEEGKRLGKLAVFENHKRWPSGRVQLQQRASTCGRWITKALAHEVPEGKRDKDLMAAYFAGWRQAFQLLRQFMLGNEGHEIVDEGVEGKSS